MITIKEVIRCADQFCEEAQVKITDGEFELTCFSHLCKFQEGQQVDVIIGALSAEHIVKSANTEYRIEKLSGIFDYSLTGKLIDKVRSIIAIGHISIEIDGYIPNDIDVGEFIDFQCARLDLT